MNMHGYIKRAAEEELAQALRRAPATAILGPRQCGKSTLAKHCLRTADSVYLDLQDRTDRNKLNEPELFFEHHRQQLVCLDEIQRLPEFFSSLRSEIDRDRRPGRFLILGSASRDLINQSSETLAGRIAYLDLTPFLVSEVGDLVNIPTYWSRGGFPESLLAADKKDSYAWRRDFIRTFLERDIPGLGLGIPAPVMERLWRLLAHYHGQTLNFSKLAAALDLTVPTLKKYIGVLEQTGMLRAVPAYSTNLRKRLVKAPKIYIRDAGVLHALLDIRNYDELLGHPVSGASWEGVCIENILAAMPDWSASFLRTSNGAEIDLIMTRGQRCQVFECKLSKAPSPSRGFHELVDDLSPDAAWIVAPVDAPYPYREDLIVSDLNSLCAKLSTL